LQSGVSAGLDLALEIARDALDLGDLPKRIATLGGILIPVTEKSHSFRDGAGNISTDAFVWAPVA
jgi:hypothetical protein